MGFPYQGKDALVVLAAIEAQETHLITGDLHHFGPYFGKRIQGILLSLAPGDSCANGARRHWEDHPAGAGFTTLISSQRPQWTLWETRKLWQGISEQEMNSRY